MTNWIAPSESEFIETCRKIIANTTNDEEVAITPSSIKVKIWSRGLVNYITLEFKIADLADETKVNNYFLDLREHAAIFKRRHES